MMKSVNRSGACLPSGAINVGIRRLAITLAIALMSFALSSVTNSGSAQAGWTIADRANQGYKKVRRARSQKRRYNSSARKKKYASKKSRKNTKKYKVSKSKYKKKKRYAKKKRRKNKKTTSRSARKNYSTASKGGGNVKWVASRSCLNARLRSIVYQVASRYGSVTVSSTCRSKSRNRRVGGAKRSKHLSGNAVDFRVHGRYKAAYAFLKSHSGVGGYKHYGGGLFHIDTGPRRTW